MFQRFRRFVAPLFHQSLKYLQSHTRRSWPRCRHQSLRLDQLEARLTPFHVTFHGGPTINDVVVQPVFYGAAWQTDNAPNPAFNGHMIPDVTGTDNSMAGASLLTVSNNLTRFLGDLVNSPYMDDLRQYTAVPRGSVAQANGIAGPIDWQDYVPTAPGTTVTDGAIQSAIDSEISSHRVVSPAPNNLYFVFLPPGVTVSDEQGDSGYHGVDGNGNYYAVILYGVTPAGTTGLTDFQDITVTASHELVESVTDPDSNVSVLTHPVGTTAGYVGHVGDSSSGEDPNSLREAVYFTGGWYDESLYAVRGTLDKAVTAFGRIVEPAYVELSSQTTNAGEVGDIPQLLAQEGNNGDFGNFDGFTVQQYFMDTFVTGSENFYGAGTYATLHDVPALPSDVIGLSIAGQPINGDFEVTSILPPVEGSFSGVIGTFYDGRGSIPNGYTATIDWGDGSKSVEAMAKPGDIPGTHTYAADEGTTVTISIEVQDSLGNVSQLTQEVTLTDAPLSATPAGGPTTSVFADSAVTLGRLVDGGNTTGSTAPYAGTISWDLGPATNAVALQATGNSNFNIVAYPTYTDSGTHTYHIVITDAGGSVATVDGTLAVAAAGLIPDPLDPAKTDLVIGGVSTGNSIILKAGANSSEVAAIVNGVDQGDFSPTGKIVIKGYAGANQLTVAFSSGTFIPPGGLWFDGGAAGVGGGILNLSGGNFRTEVDAPTGKGSGTITLTSASGTRTITYQNVQPINDTASATDFTIPDPTSGDQVNVINDPNGAENGFRATQVSSGTGAFDGVNFANKTNVTVADTSAGGGATFNLNNPAFGNGLATLIVRAASTGAGSTTNVLATPAGVTTNVVGGPADTVNVGNNGTVQGIAGLLNVENPHGRNFLALDDSATALGRLVTLGTLGTNPADSEADAAPWGVVRGLAPADIRYEYGDNNHVTIDGGTGGNTYTVTDLPQLGTVFNINGGSVPGTLVGPNFEAVFAITGFDSGSLGGAAAVNFTGIDNLIGGTANDQFVLAPGGFERRIDGGSGNNTIVGAPNHVNFIEMTGANAGLVPGVLGNFVNIENLGGSTAPHNTGTDVFECLPNGSLSGQVVGGTGNEFLDYAPLARAVRVNLAAGTASRIAGGVTHTAGVPMNVIGSAAGGDVIIGDSAGGLLEAHQSGNTLLAGSGRSILIGGYGKNFLEGGAGDDLVIGGRTAYDYNIVALTSILAEWRSTKVFATRVADLRTGQGLANDARLILGQTVFVTATPPGPRIGRGGGNSQSTLIGNGAQNWFFALYATIVVDLKKTDAVD